MTINLQFLASTRRSSAGLGSLIAEASILAALMLLASCTQDVTYSPEYSFSGAAGKCYATKNISKVGRFSGEKELTLMVAIPEINTGISEAIPHTRQEYDDQLGSGRMAYLPSNTMVRFDKVLYTPLSDTYRFEAYGHLVSGPLAGESVMAFNFVDDFPSPHAPDFKYFAPCDREVAPQASPSRPMSTPSSLPTKTNGM
jgi:hypothetical protein